MALAPSFVLAHPVDGLLARLGQQLGVLDDLAADEVAQTRYDVSADMPDADRVAAHQAEVLDDLLSGYRFCR
jgi:hypothetical protein